MKDNKDRPFRYKVSPENIFIQTYQPTYENGKKMFDRINKEIFLSDVNGLEFRCDGNSYIDKVEGSIFNSPSKHVRDIIKMTTEFVRLFDLHEKIDDFLKRMKVSSMKELHINNQGIDQWYCGVNYVYPLRPDIEVNTNYPTFYKFFLPFKLKHIKPENVENILDYHRNKYYKSDHRSFYNLLSRILESNDAQFWLNNKTPFEIKNWLGRNPLEEVFYWFEFSSRINGPTKKKIISKIFRDLLKASPPLLDSKESFQNFYRIFSKPNNKTQFKKVNWVGSYDELNYLIKTLVDRNMITCKHIWITTSNLFLVDGEAFSNNKIGNKRRISDDQAVKMDKIIDRFRNQLLEN